MMGLIMKIETNLIKITNTDINMNSFHRIEVN